MKVGDRIKMLEREDGAEKGMTGIIKSINGRRIAVEFDEKFDEGHNCNGETHPKKGHFIYDTTKLKSITSWKDILSK